MPLATICGLPASGKTTFAEGLVAFLRNELGEARRVVLVNEEGVRIGKHEGYRGALDWILVVCVLMCVWEAPSTYPTLLQLLLGGVQPIDRLDRSDRTESTHLRVHIHTHIGLSPNSSTDRNTDAAAEKETRGSLRAAVDHALNAKTVVVLDSLNYIKGFRYQLYCAARAESTQHCVVRFVRCALFGSCCVCYGVVSGPPHGFDPSLARSN